MLVFISQVLEFLPVPYEKLYADYGELDGIGFWYEKAVEIDRKKAKAAKAK